MPETPWDTAQILKAIKNSGTLTTNENGRRNVTFERPHTDATYVVQMAAQGQNTAYICTYALKTATGFRAYSYDTAGALTGGVIIDWCTAIRTQD